MALSVPARWVLTAPISVGLCCCNVEGLLGGDCSGEAEGSGQLVAAIDDHHHAHFDDDGHHGSQEAPPSPCGPCDHQHGGPCACGSHEKAPVLVQKNPLDLPLTLVAVLAVETAVPPTLTARAPHFGDSRAVLPPHMSLLRQHCALIV